MALAAPQEFIEFLGPTVRVPAMPKASETLYRGALVVYDADGFLTEPSDAASLVPAGVYTGYRADPETGLFTAPSSGMEEVEVEKGLAWVPFTSAVQTDVGEIFYFGADDAVTKTAGSKTIGVRCHGVRIGEAVLLDLAHPWVP